MVGVVEEEKENSQNANNSDSKGMSENGGGSTNSPKATDKHPSDIALMKERFAKLLLGEDMSGGGKGVSSALALSNAITNTAASVFGEIKRLEPMPPERKARWRKEIDWLLSVTDYIVELVPSKQKGKDGSTMEIMVTRQRNDLHMNIPALRKLDGMLGACLDSFKDQNEFTYASKDDPDSKGKGRKDDKWWLPIPKVPPNGLTEASKKWIQSQKDSVNQVHKAAMAINAQVIAEMEIPESYIEALPKNGRASLGDSIYRSITDEYFDPDYFLSSMDLTSEHKILDLKDRIEASVVIWKRKMTAKNEKSTWSSAVSIEKRELFEERAETILLILKHRFPGIPQSSLDISKIQYNRDVGHAILESYSRIIESLAFTVLSRIEDVLHADQIATNPPEEEESGERACAATDRTTSMTLLDFMGWGLDQGDSGTPRNDGSDDSGKEGDMAANKPPDIPAANKKGSYVESIGSYGSPIARQ
ncbi:PREDICTED: rop guanine nucleotide exchange factor 12-like [Ipomoea nil]|uniref:rop guanine nucleotide exchange factor 12-like n=1 Tax=Ipomoea nil TaxID=35883 RepID=UPI0009017315|nr:PREDICTED: rop guanine nucleotide exchange factor 12-like [Ipomoea nil]